MKIFRANIKFFVCIKVGLLLRQCKGSRSLHLIQKVRSTGLSPKIFQNLVLKIFLYHYYGLLFTDILVTL